MRPTSRPILKMSGFTLVEMVVVITIVAILAAAATQLIRNPAQSFIDSENRANLTDRADTALRRMARDIRNALPNSVRTTTNGADSFIEFVPVKTAGRYRAAVGASVSDDPLDFSLSADTFDVLGSNVTIASGDKLVIYNLGIPGSDVYESPSTNIRALLTIGTLSTLSFSGGTFPQASPSSRFYVVSTPVSYVCDMTDAGNKNGKLLRYSGYTIQPTQPSSLSTTIQPSRLVIVSGLAVPDQLATGLTACSIKYDSAVLQRNGIATIYLTLEQDSAKVTLMHQVNVVNSP